MRSSESEERIRFLPLPLLLSIPASLMLQFGRFAIVFIDFLNDTATSEVLQTLQAAYGTNVTVTLKQTSAATSATNPLYTMTCLVNNITPINGAVGDLSTQSVTWNVSGTVVVTTA